ncbi:uncharacterized protein BDZ99DRAFT_524417 [Mytilinidion resinicola]|uniref:Uncharacterized protein n=1 Tax=Mytilinidion resinicola TaxID=574789 RepID=A0A6A6YBF9_9PEZI|nr:uncharacterized protein BDZ99DRAFT_524417 [Mytilinidion resinicola]KAF2805445.1 hypothetical protein BDZ99DRAFT_524417 [Mytilinidion resinicola]
MSRCLKEKLEELEKDNKKLSGLFKGVKKRLHEFLENNLRLYDRQFHPPAAFERKTKKQALVVTAQDLIKLGCFESPSVLGHAIVADLDEREEPDVKEREDLFSVGFLGLTELRNQIYDHFAM